VDYNKVGVFLSLKFGVFLLILIYQLHLEAHSILITHNARYLWYLSNLSLNSHLLHVTMLPLYFTTNRIEQKETWNNQSNGH
jgi:hypothetical protein